MPPLTKKTLLAPAAETLPPKDFDITTLKNRGAVSNSPFLRGREEDVKSRFVGKKKMDVGDEKNIRIPVNIETASNLNSTMEEGKTDEGENLPQPSIKQNPFLLADRKPTTVSPTRIPQSSFFHNSTTRPPKPSVSPASKSKSSLPVARDLLPKPIGATSIEGFWPIHKPLGIASSDVDVKVTENMPNRGELGRGEGEKRRMFGTRCEGTDSEGLNDGKVDGGESELKDAEAGRRGDDTSRGLVKTELDDFNSGTSSGKSISQIDESRRTREKDDRTVANDRHDISNPEVLRAVDSAERKGEDIMNDQETQNTSMDNTSLHVPGPNSRQGENIEYISDDVPPPYYEPGRSNLDVQIPTTDENEKENKPNTRLTPPTQAESTSIHQQEDAKDEDKQQNIPPTAEPTELLPPQQTTSLLPPSAPSSTIRKRIWSPTRLQIPSLTSLLDDTDLFPTFLSSASRTQTESGIESHQQHQPQPQDSESEIQIEIQHVKSEEDVETRPSQPREERTLAHPSHMTPPAAEHAIAPTEAAAPPPTTLAPRPPDPLPRTESLRSIVDSIIYPPTKPKPKKKGKTVRFGQAWKNQLRQTKIIPCSSYHDNNSDTESVYRSPMVEWMEEGRIGVLYLRVCRLEGMYFQTDQGIEITINIRQQNSPRTYEHETTIILPPNQTTIDINFDCEIPLLPTHPLSLMFYFRSRYNGEDSNQIHEGKSSLGKVAGRMMSKHREGVMQQRKPSLMKFWKGKKGGEKGVKIKVEESSSHQGERQDKEKSDPAAPAATSSPNTPAPAPAPPQTRPFPPSSLLVAETTPPIPPVSLRHTSKTPYPAKLLNWTPGQGLTHSETLATVILQTGFLPLTSDPTIDISTYPHSFPEYDLSTRIIEWNDLLSMEGHLWQLGGDVKGKYQKRYYRLIGPTLHVYAPSRYPTTTKTPWTASDLTHSTHLPPPLSQSHGKKICTISLGDLESWEDCALVEGGRCRTPSFGSIKSIPEPATDSSQPKTDTIEIPPPPQSTPTLSLTFKDTRRINLRIDPEEVTTYNQETDWLHHQLKQEGIEAAKGEEWMAVDILDMWKQALMEVLNGIRYEVPGWVEGVRKWREKEKEREMEKEREREMEREKEKVKGGGVV